MIKEGQDIPKTEGSHKKIVVICDSCKVEREAEYKNIIKSRKKRNSSEDLCQRCSFLKTVKSDLYRANMSKVITKMHEDNPEIAHKISNTMKEKGINVGDNNRMKKKENRDKVSKTRKQMFRDGKISRENISKSAKDRWKQGKYDNSRVGQCNWYDYETKKGDIISCQGTWELAFVFWADKNNLSIISHKGRITYFDDFGSERSYYPDFFVKDWDSYIEIKNAYHWELQKEKFSCIFKSNPKLKLKILFKEDLVNLGIDLKYFYENRNLFCRRIKNELP